MKSLLSWTSLTAILTVSLTSYSSDRQTSKSPNISMSLKHNSKKPNFNIRFGGAARAINLEKAYSTKIAAGK